MHIWRACSMYNILYYVKLPGSRQINDGTNFGDSEMFLYNIIIGRSDKSYITLYSIYDVHFFRFLLLTTVWFLGGRKEDQRRRAEGGQTENDCHGSQEDRRTLSSAVRAVRILFHERHQQTASVVLARRRHRQGKYFKYVYVLGETKIIILRLQHSSFRYT